MQRISCARPVNEGVRFLRTTDITEDGSLIDESDAVFVPEELVDDGLIRLGDVLFSRSGTIGRAYVHSATSGRCAHAGYLVRFRPGAHLDPRWLFYFSKSAEFDVQISENIVETTIANFNGQKFANLRIPFIQRTVQTSWCDQLDDSCARIDAAIAAKEALLTKLAEQRLSTITHAVTRGLDPNVATKHSGVEWIGEIPSHWTVIRVSRIARLESGHTPSRSVPEHWLETNDVPWVSLADTKQLEVADYISDTEHHINELGLKNSSARLLPKGVVVFTRDASIGKAAITTRPMAVSQHLIAWVCGPDIVNRFLLRVFYAMRKELDRYTFGATIATIGMDDVKSLVTPLPPLAEQEAIADFLDAKCAALDAAMEKIRRQVELLRAYRQSVITAYVTGKIAVPPSPGPVNAITGAGERTEATP